MKDSELTFGEISKDLLYVQVWWNGIKVYDDYDSDDSTLEDLNKFEEKYNDMIVYSYYVEIVDFHHCILEVEGQV